MSESSPELYEIMKGHDHVLPPRTGGVLALLDSGMDVVFGIHTGLESVRGLKEIWQEAPVGRRVKVTFRRVAAADVRRSDGPYQLAARGMGPGRRPHRRPAHRRPLLAHRLRYSPSKPSNTATNCSRACAPSITEAWPSNNTTNVGVVLKMPDRAYISSRTPSTAARLPRHDANAASFSPMPAARPVSASSGGSTDHSSTDSNSLSRIGQNRPCSPAQSAAAAAAGAWG